jgi:hypothetical protein
LTCQAWKHTGKWMSDVKPGKCDQGGLQPISPSLFASELGH